MKTVGIVCDNYKVSKFKKELSAIGIRDVEEIPYGAEGDKLSLLRILCKESEVHEVNKTCQKVELHFKRGN